MLHPACPRVARALIAGQRRARFTAAFGSFAQRTIDRRFCGLSVAGSCFALSRLQSPADPHGRSARARLAGGHPSRLVWSW